MDEHAIWEYIKTLEGSVPTDVSELDNDIGFVKSAYFYTGTITATTITAVNTNTKIPITGIPSGRASGFTYDSTNKGIKVTESGMYALTAALSANPATSGDLMGVSIHRNGSEIIAPTYLRMGGNYDTVSLVPTIVPLDAGDVLTLFGRNNSSARGTFTGARFSGWRVG